MKMNNGRYDEKTISTINQQYIIIVENENGFVGYLSIDHNSGGYLRISTFLKHAKIFDSVEEAEKIFKSSDFTHVSEMSNGTLYPPLMVQLGCELCNTKKEGACLFEVCEISYNVKSSKSFSGEIKEPKGFVY